MTTRQRPALTARTVVSRNPDLLVRRVADVTLMTSVERATYFGLEDVGTRIWELLEEPRPLADVCARLLAEYDVEAARCEAEVLDFVTALLNAGLVRRADA